ncbi:MAG TPA: CDP-diacylglycerol--glycerol-3-phosphate 3-phosphatidyltransferase [Acidothermaceae bacterium]|nr:CDP-diacylglycerol--glycerol-3-phosphate 3-phosphatidyltransferase [Acidothermaceae bacterium]
MTAPGEQLGAAVPGEPSATGAKIAPARPLPPHVGVANLANGLTVARLLMVPLFAALLAAAGSDQPDLRLAATAVFVVASLTDRVDGEIARRRSIITDFGKIADPIADKALTGAALIGLSAIGDLPWWVTVVVLIRELGVTALRFWVIRRGVIAASRGGKVKTVVQAVAIGLYLLPINAFWGTVRWWLMAVAVAVTLGTGVDYVARAVRLRRAPRARGR